MELNIENILSELMKRVAIHFNMDYQEALAAVAESNIANELSRTGDTMGMSIDELSKRLNAEIAQGEGN